MMTRQVPIGITFFMFAVCLVHGRTSTMSYKGPAGTLKLLHVVFRHGDRTQDRPYPNDPYQNETFYPIGVGHLTNAGKLRAYNIGTYLRETYGDFLGDVYSPGILEANSSPYPRCTASLQLVLSALFPPTEVQQWSNSLNWQPIPYDYVPAASNLYFLSFRICSKYIQFHKAYQATTEYQSVYAPYEQTLSYLKEKSGYTSDSYPMSLTLFSTLRSQQELDLELPEWTQSVWPELISEIAKLDWQNMFATEETRAIGAGFLLSKIINDTQLTIDGDSSVEGMKIHLHSGHDVNIAGILSWIGVGDIRIPQYGSFIVFEIREILGIPFVTIIHQNYEYEEPQVIKIPDCGFYCPFNTFVRLYAKYTNRYDLCN